MASSQHRPGAKVSLSPAAYAKDKMKKVENLENQLANLPSKKNDEQKSKLRVQLCEMLSDVILKAPLPALKHDCVGHLWRSCFYGTISTLRQRISKEKKKGGPNLSKLQNTLSSFISEAVTLYDYLIDQYQKKLIPNGASLTQGSQQSSESLSQSSFNDSQSQTPSTDTAGVVAGLFRMYIHLGDLHRYDCKYKESQLNYVNASKLSPGRGNPYNQLAVVSQLKDTAAPLNTVALYWYARSLLTTDEPFEVSKANLARLFQSNRDWFHKQPPPPDDVLKPNNGNGRQELPKAVRSVASRHFLSQFVDLHFSFFQGIASEKDRTGDNPPSDDEVVAQIEAALTPLSVLLRSSAFGDPLLCKMVAICAFSESYRPTENEEIDSGLTRVLARMFTLSFGASLAERVAIGIAKIKDQPEKIGNPGKAPSSVRLLQPMLLLCEYVESCPIDTKTVNMSPRSSTFCETAVNTFWQRTVDVLNLLANLRGPLNLNNEQLQNSRIKEFDGLIGFAPFTSFLKDPMASSREDGFASIEEAIEVLELPSPEQSSPELTPSPVEEYKIKFARLLAFGDRMAEDSTKSAGRRFGRTSNGTYVWHDAHYDDDSDDPMMDSENMQENNTQPLPAGKGSDDVLVYSVPQGGGPALLVPGMLLQNRALGSAVEDNAAKQKSRANSGGSVSPVAAPAQPGVALNVTFGMAGDPLIAHQSPAAPQSSVMPPPGFGGGSPRAITGAPGMPQDHLAMPQGHVGMGTNLGALNYGHGSAFAQGLPPALHYQQLSYQPTIANSMYLFGGAEALQTDNPFAAASMPSLDGSGNMTMMDLNLGGVSSSGGNGAALLHFGTSGVADSTSTLLSSGFLHSLFEDSGDKTSQNPFAT